MQTQYNPVSTSVTPAGAAIAARAPREAPREGAGGPGGLRVPGGHLGHPEGFEETREGGLRVP